MPHQTRLLRVLQTKKFNVSVAKPPFPLMFALLASNKPLQDRRSWQISTDLLYRINIFPDSYPRLNDRKDDITRLRTVKPCKPYGLAPSTLTARAQDYLLHHDWKGNVEN